MAHNHFNPGPFSASDLPIRKDGKVYHLCAQPQDLAPDILLVGDPDRTVAIQNNFFDKNCTVQFYESHRGLRTYTGIIKDTNPPHRVTLATSGMGTPSTEIVLGEIVTLNELDFNTRIRKTEFPLLRIVRVGTSGELQATTPLGTAILSLYAVGLDNTGLFYSGVSHPNLEGLEERVYTAITNATKDGRIKGKIHPYAAPADSGLFYEMIQSAKDLKIPIKEGITVSNAGFFANQGRDVFRVAPTIPDIDGILSKINSGLMTPTKNLLFENMEMETSFLFHFMYAQGYAAGSLCVVIANRRAETFQESYEKEVLDAAHVALKALQNMRESRGYAQNIIVEKKQR